MNEPLPCTPPPIAVEAEFFALFNLPGNSRAALDPKSGRLLRSNAELSRLTGYTAAELGRMTLSDLVHPEDQPSSRLLLQRLFDQEIDHCSLEKRLVDKRGEPVWVRVHAGLARDSSGRVVSAVATLENVSAKKRAAEEIERTQRELTDLIENAAVAIHWVGPDGRILWANQAELELLGYAREEYIGRHISEFHVDAAVIQDILCRLVNNETLVNYEARLRAKDGTLRQVMINSNVYRENGEFRHTRCFTRDFTARLQAEESRVRLAAIVESSDDAIISKDLNGVVQSWNAAAERIFGYSAAEMIGQPILKLIPADRWQEEASILDRLCRGQRIEHFDTVRMHKDGGRLDVSITISPLRGANGKVIGASKIVRDIGAQTQAQRERDYLLASERTARNEAERLSRIKDEFLATLSHELRTPLNAILGWAHLLGAGGLTDVETAQGVETIERNARSQVQIIDDLLDMSRIISGKIRVEIERVDLGQVVEAAVQSVLPALELKGIRLERQVDPHSVGIMGDPNRLQQVVWNLLSNAIKFTPSGGWVQIALERAEPHVRLTISDSGQGIAAEFLPHVFERFRQADSSTTRRHGGLGMGLSIVKQLVELHGGTARVESEGPGLGSRFIVALPLGVGATPPVEPNPTRQPVTARKIAVDAQQVMLDGLRVLVVDDEPDARQLIRKILEDRRAHVITASSVAGALGVFQQFQPQVLLSDIGMPGQDGYDLIGFVRALPLEQGGATPALALTAFARSEDRRRALHAGFQMHLCKPFDAGELVAMVASLSGRVPV